MKWRVFFLGVLICDCSDEEGFIRIASIVDLAFRLEICKEEKCTEINLKTDAKIDLKNITINGM